MRSDFYPVFNLFVTACTKFYSFGCVSINLATSPSGVHPFSNQWTPMAVLSETKRTDLEANNLLPHSDSTKNTRSSTSIVHLQGETQKFLDNCYKTQKTSYMDMIYFYSSKYIPP